MKTITIILSSAGLLGAAAAANGLFMLGDPMRWYYAVPGVTATGPFNQHFIRDIGLTYLLIGIALILGAARPAWRFAFWSMSALWLTGHAIFHLWLVAVGICGTSTMVQDFPAVTLPAILVTGLAVWAFGAARRDEAERQAAWSRGI